MAPQDEASRQRRLRLQAAKQRERERFHAEWSRLYRAYCASEGI
jgi:hypothetical protein